VEVKPSLLLDIAVAQLHHEAISGQEIGAALGPFDDEDAPFGIIPEAEVVQLFNVLDTVEVDVEELFAPLVFVHQHERRAVHLAAEAEAAANALGEAGLTCAKVPAEKDDVTPLKHFAEPFAEGPGLFLIGGREVEVFHLHHTRNGIRNRGYAIRAVPVREVGEVTRQRVVFAARGFAAAQGGTVSDTVNIAVTFRVDEDILEGIRAIGPRVRLVDYPMLALRPGEALTPEQLSQAAAALADVEVILGTNGLPRPLLDAAPRLKWFQVIQAGVENMKADGMLDRGFVVTNGSGIASVPIAEWVLGAMLMLCKGMHTTVHEQQRREWRFRFTRALEGKTCGIIGMGAIGRAVATRARAFDMRVIATRRTVNTGDSDPDCDALFAHNDLHRVLAESDYVVLCVPHTAETNHLIGAAELAAMKPTGYLLNIARGAVIDQPALVAALEAGTIAGAALDVTDPEPLPADSPLWENPNVIITPHMSGAVEGYGHRAGKLFIDNLQRYLRGEPLLNVVDPRLAY
jgi:phosphoglycerate dehydrogenase-like enzyme